MTKINTKRKTNQILIVLYSVLSLTANAEKPALVDYVDTKTGVADKRTNNCVVGPMMPFGSINPSPQTLRDSAFRYGGHDGYDPGMPVSGFGQLHVSGTGWGSYGHFLISPQVGLNVAKGSHDSPESTSVTKAYHFKTKLDRYNIIAEVSPRYYSAMYRFRFPATDSATIVFDASQSIGLDIATVMGGTIYDNSVMIDSLKRQICGKIKIRSGWPEGAYTLYFVAECNKPFLDWGVWNENSVYRKKPNIIRQSLDNKHIGAYCRFRTNENEAILMKVAISFCGFDNAEQFLKREIAHWDFEKVVSQGKSDWNAKLRTIQIQTNSIAEKTQFYSAMYRVLTMARDRSLDNPNLQSEQPYWDDNYAFWDTWRTAFPMLLLIDNEAYRDNVLALLDRFKNNGFLRDGFIAGRDKTEEQGGNDVDNILAEAVLKNVQGIDVSKVYNVLKYDADNERNGLPDKFWKTDTLSKKNNKRYKEQGWIPQCVMSSSNTIEYAYNDFCVAQVAKITGKMDDYNKYLKRSMDWVNLWNDTLESKGYRGFIDARKSDRSFAGICPERSGGSWKSPFYEGDSWTYSFSIPHGYYRLFELMGGRDEYVKRLDFALRNRLIDLTNEPAFLIVRSFSEAGRPDLTSYWTHHVMNKYFDITGYPGNEDTGAMSSWYMFSAMGIFPKAGTDFYYLNAPKFSKTVLTLANSKRFVIMAKNAGKDAIYIRSCKINGKEWSSALFRHTDIENGGKIEMELSTVPTEWGKN
jgi:predicted alpha-1,2-mannosidase